MSSECVGDLQIFPPAQKVRVASLHFCHNGECTFSEDLHLLVKTYEAELKSENAIAIRCVQVPKLVNITRTEQLYGALVHPFQPLILGRGDTIPFRAYGERHQPLSIRSRDFQEVFAGKITSVVFEWVRQIADEWPMFIFNKFMRSLLSAKLGEYKASTVDEHVKDIEIQSPGSILSSQLMIESTLSKDPTSVYAMRSWQPGYPEFNTEPTVYRMVATALGLDYGLCKEQGMVLAVSLTKPFCVGLTTRSFYNWRNARGSADKDVRIRTFCTGMAEPQSGFTL